MKSNSRHLHALIMTALVLSSALVIFVPQETEAQATPDFNLSVSPGAIILDVSPSGTGFGTTTVTVTSNSAHTITVHVSISVPGYIVSPMESDVTLSPGTSSNIGVVVSAVLRSPYQIKSGNIHGEVTQVDGAPISGGYTKDTGLMVQSRPYARVVLSSDKPFQKVQPGKQYQFKIKIFNDGNAADEFNFEVTNKDKLSDKGFSITLSSSQTQQIDSKTYQWITINIQTPRDHWSNKYYTIDMRATSRVDPSQHSDYSITTWVWGFYVPGFDATFSIIALGMIGAFMVRRRQGQV